MEIRNDHRMPKKAKNLAWKQAHQQSEVDFKALLDMEMAKYATPKTRQELLQEDV